MKSKLSLTVIFFFIFNCEPKNYRIHNPATPLESEKQAIVGFGCYRLTSGLFGKGAEIGPRITLVEVISVDDKNKKLVTAPFEYENPSEVKEGSETIYYTNKITMKNFYVMLLLDAKKKYAIQSITWTESCGQKCTYSVTKNFTLYDSFKALPIQAKANEINFRGVHQVSIVETSDDDPDGLNDPTTELGEILKKTFSSYKKKKAILNIAEEEITKNELDELKKDFYDQKIFYKGKLEPKWAEEKFLKEFIVNQKDGYWKVKAEAKLAKMSK